MENLYEILDKYKQRIKWQEELKDDQEYEEYLEYMKNNFPGDILLQDAYNKNYNGEVTVTIVRAPNYFLQFARMTKVPFRTTLEIIDNLNLKIFHFIFRIRNIKDVEKIIDAYYMELQRIEYYEKPAKEMQQSAKLARERYLENHSN